MKMKDWCDVLDNTASVQKKLDQEEEQEFNDEEREIADELEDKGFSLLKYVKYDSVGNRFIRYGINDGSGYLVGCIGDVGEMCLEDVVEWLYQEEDDETIGSHVCWTFMHDYYDDIAEFREALRNHTNEILDRKVTDKELDRVCVDAPAFTIQNEDDYFDESFIITLRARNGRNFTITELLWKLNNYFYKENILSQHLYFEGIEPDGRISLGS